MSCVASSGLLHRHPLTFFFLRSLTRCGAIHGLLSMHRGGRTLFIPAVHDLTFHSFRRDGHEVRCIISIENWTQWLLSFPVTYSYYGGFQRGLHEREVFSAHREAVVAVNELDSVTGTSGVVAWELGRKNIHLIIMW